MPAAAQAVGPRYPISAESGPGESGGAGWLEPPGPPGRPGTSLSSNRVPCKPAAAEALLPAGLSPSSTLSSTLSSPLVTATPTSTGADYPRYSHRKPTQAAASTTTDGASRHSRQHRGRPARAGSGSGGPAEVLGRDR